MGADFWIVLQWWGTLFLVGAVAYPLTKRPFGGPTSLKLRGAPLANADVEDGRATRLGLRSYFGEGGSLGEGWWDGGYLFSKAVGMATVTWIVYVLGTLRVMPFSVASIGVALGVVFVVGIWFHKEDKGDGGDKGGRGWKRAALLMALEEIFFFMALLFWSWVKGHEPSIRGLEKFMDYGFMQSILNSTYFPPADMWYAPLSINYYYFGHMVTAVLTRLSGLDLAYTFNLMLATIFALTLTMSFSIGYQLFKFQAPSIKSQTSTKHQFKNSKFGIWNLEFVWNLRFVIWNLLAGLLTAFLVTMAGNMQTIYAFTRGYTGDKVKPFWELFWTLGPPSSRFAGLWGVKELWGKLGEGMNTYWYPNATRFIPFTIHEFPSYSFVVSDVHGHVLSIPFVLLAIGLLIQLSAISSQQSAWLKAASWKLMTIFYGFLVGVLLMTNALDGPIYLGLFAIILGISNFSREAGSRFAGQFPISKWKKTGAKLALVIAVAGLTSLPFLVHFKSFVTGVAVNCPPSFLANTKIGPLIFEGVEKCQRSPLWMWWLLWGFFVYCGGWLIIKISNFQFPISNQAKKFLLNTKIPQIEKLLIVFFVFSLALVIFPEFFYFKDIYPAHFRSNTMFKLGYEAFVLFSIVSGYSIVQGLFHLYVHSDRNAKCQMPNAKWGTRIFFVFLLPQLILVSIFPIFAVRSYFNSLKTYQGIEGFGWMRREYPDDWKAIEWLNNRSKQKVVSSKGKIEELLTTNYLLPATRYFSSPILVEADGDSYTDYARFSAFTGHPTIIGWAVHEWLWRGSYDVVAPRREEVRIIYESEDIDETKKILAAYNVSYIIVGKLEREKYKSLQEWKFSELGREVFRSGSTVIYFLSTPPLTPHKNPSIIMIRTSAYDH